MFGSMKRRKIARQRVEAVAERQTAVEAFATALTQAEDAFAALRQANDRFYRSHDSGEQAILSGLRRDRERVFVVHVSAHLTRHAPNLARLLGITTRRQQPVSLPEWIHKISEQDLRAVGRPEDYPQTAEPSHAAA